MWFLVGREALRKGCFVSKLPLVAACSSWRRGPGGGGEGLSGGELGSTAPTQRPAESRGRGSPVRMLRLSCSCSLPPRWPGWRCVAARCHRS